MAEINLFKELRLSPHLLFLFEADDLASVIWRDSHAFQRFGHLALKLLWTDILRKDLDQMLDADISIEMQIVLFKGEVDMFSQVRIFL